LLATSQQKQTTSKQDVFVIANPGFGSITISKKISSNN